MGGGLWALTAFLIILSRPDQLDAQSQADGSAERTLQQGDHIYDPQALFTEEKQKEEVSGVLSILHWMCDVDGKLSTNLRWLTRSQPLRSSAVAQTRTMSKIPWDMPTPWLA